MSKQKEGWEFLTDEIASEIGNFLRGKSDCVNVMQLEFKIRRIVRNSDMAEEFKANAVESAIGELESIARRLWTTVREVAPSRHVDYRAVKIEYEHLR